MVDYRKDIDGLRCIAVSSVILYHIGFKFIPGGFLGVDIFFVISGYLITSISLKRFNNNNFTIIDFYKNRIRRIFPVLIFILFFFTIFNLSFAQLSSQETSLFLNSLSSSVFFLSNLFFTYNIGYFAVSSDLLHLIHTWSLAVEEQFYILFPFVFLIFNRLSSRKILYFSLLIIVLSFILKVLYTKTHPNHTFYLLPTRIWEMGIGCIIPYVRKPFIITKLKNILYSISVISIVFILFTYEENNYTIHIYPLVICLFSSIVLYCNNASGLVYNILTNKIFRTVGLMSFSLYLWHQPIFATVRNFSYHPEVLSSLIIFLSLIVVLVFSYLSYRFIEIPFRQKKINVKTVVSVYVSLAVTIIYVRIYHFPTETEVRNDPNRDIARNHYDADIVEDSGYYFGHLSEENNTKSILLLGDSHARMFIPSLSNELKKIGYLGFHPSQNIIGDDDLALKQVNKPELLNKWIDEIKRLSKFYDYIVLSYRFTKFLNGKWNYHYDEKGNTPYVLKTNLNLVNERLQQLINLSDNIIVIGPVPETAAWGPNLNRYRFGKVLTSKYDKYYNENKELLGLLNTLENNNENLTIILPEDFLFDENRSFKEFSYSNGSMLPYFYDDDHLSITGSSKISKQIIKQIKANEF